MYYIYFIQSIKFPENNYVGYTQNLKERLNKHNLGNCGYTSKYKPWELIFFIGLNDKSQALEFEKYLKTYSGKAFIKKRFLKS